MAEKDRRDFETRVRDEGPIGGVGRRVPHYHTRRDRRWGAFSLGLTVGGPAFIIAIASWGHSGLVGICVAASVAGLSAFVGWSFPQLRYLLLPEPGE